MDTISDDQRTQLSSLFSLVSSPSPTSPAPTIGHKELGFILRAVGVYSTESEIRDLISEVDTSGVGLMDYSEFVNLFSRSIAAEAEPYEEIQAAFDEIGNGQYANVKDLREAFNKMGVQVKEEEVKEMVAEADVDNNGGKISRADFKYMMETRHKVVGE